MFNFIVLHHNWTPQDREVKSSVSRMLEYTDDNIQNEFCKNDQYDLNALSKLPCLFLTEGIEDEKAYVGTICDLRQISEEIHFTVIIDESIPILCNRFLYEHHAALGIDVSNDSAFSEFDRNHWSVKDVDLYKFIAQKARLSRQHPTVFSIPKSESIDPKSVSAMMPFDSSFDDIFARV